MDRYEKMLECNRKASDEKIERARKAIFELMDEGERVTVPRLMEKTGQTYLDDSFYIFTKTHIENLKKLPTKEAA